MKIVHILEATQGGTRRHVLDLLPSLVRRGVQCELIYSARRYAAFGDDAKYLESCGVRTHEVTMTRGLDWRADIHALRTIHHYLCHSAPDIVHCHSTKAGLLGRLASQSTSKRVPVVYTPHCLAFDTGLPRLTRRATRWMEKLLAPLTAHFIAVSRHEAHAMRAVRLAPPRQISVIYNGLNLPEFDHFRSNEAHSVAHDFTIGCFGRLSPQKNQQTLLRALPAVREVVPNARVLLVGGGEDEAKLHHLATQLNLVDHVTFAGELAEPRPRYFECDVVAQPARWESCPYSVLEAMAARRAIVAAPVGGIPELLGDDGGVLCRPNDATHLAQHLTSLLHRETREALGEAARARVEKHFVLDEMVRQTLTVYQRVLR